MVSVKCIVCSSKLTLPFYNPSKQPLAALSLPKTQEDALHAPRFEMDFVACASCGHIFNQAFDYYKVPYSEDSNLMYNSGSIWIEHLNAVADILVGMDLSNKCVIDIGCGDGGFLQILKDKEPNARYIGFEPGIEYLNAIDKNLEIYQDYFLPEREIS